MRRFPALFAILAALTLFGSAPPSHAAILFSDDFSGYSGGLAGENGGVGWAGAWAGTNISVTNAGIGSAGGLTSAGPSVFHSQTAFWDATRAVAPVSNEVFYIDVLMRVNYSGSWPSARYGGIGLYSGTTELFTFGQFNSSGNWAVYHGASGAYVGQDNIPNNQTVRVVAKVDQVHDVATMWINPNVSLSEAANPFTSQLSYLGPDDFNSVHLRAGDGNSSPTWAFDNLKLSSASPFAGAPIEQGYLKTDTTWRARPTAPGAGWNSDPGFDDSNAAGWQDAATAVGNPNRIWYETTVNSPNFQSWFRKEFEVTGDVDYASLHVLVDDNVEVYINGVRVVNDIDFGATNINPDIDPNLFHLGTNLIAAHATNLVTPGSHVEMNLTLNYSVVPVPEPSTLALAGIALAGLVTRFCRRKPRGR